MPRIHAQKAVYGGEPMIQSGFNCLINLYASFRSDRLEKFQASPFGFFVRNSMALRSSMFRFRASQEESFKILPMPYASTNVGVDGRRRIEHAYRVLDVGRWSTCVQWPE